MNTVYTLGIDIGGTKIAAALVNPQGTHTPPLTVATPVGQGAAAILDAVGALGRRVLAQADAPVVAAGVGAAGQVDTRRGVITHAVETIPGWTGAPVREHLSRLFNLPCVVDNDVNAMAYGEIRTGAAADAASALFVTIGTGVGGALVFDGRILHGATWTAGELGHMLVNAADARACMCGGYGHLEAYASGPALAAAYAAQTGRALDLRHVAALAADGDLVARRVIAEGAALTGAALAGLLNVFDAAALIVGGGVPEIGALWWQPFEAAVRANPLPGPRRVVLYRAAPGTAAVVVGAGLLAHDALTRGDDGL